MGKPSTKSMDCPWYHGQRIQEQCIIEIQMQLFDSAAIPDGSPGTHSSDVKKSIYSSRIGDGECNCTAAGCDVLDSFSTGSKRTFACSYMKLLSFLNQCSLNPGWQTEMWWVKHMWHTSGHHIETVINSEWIALCNLCNLGEYKFRRCT